MAAGLTVSDGLVVWKAVAQPSLIILHEAWYEVFLNIFSHGEYKMRNARDLLIEVIALVSVISQSRVTSSVSAGRLRPA